MSTPSDDKYEDLSNSDSDSGDDYIDITPEENNEGGGNNDEDEDDEDDEDDDNEEDEEDDTEDDNEKNVDESSIQKNTETENGSDTSIKEVNKNECIYNIAAPVVVKKVEVFLYSPKKNEKDQRMSKKILYHYEKVKVIGDRIKQLDNNAKPMIKNVKGLTNKEIAILELESIIKYKNENGEEITNKALPFILHRELPNGTIEVFRLGELEIL